MKLLKPFAILILSIMFLPFGQTQDLHFSNYNMLPVNMNPAMAGAFNGTARLSVLTRGQWWSVSGGNPVSGNGYNTLGVSVDSPVIRGLRKKDWIGVGLTYHQDKAGTGDFTYGGSNLGLSYHLSLDKKQTSVLTLGIQRASYNYSVGNSADFISRPLLAGSPIDTDIEALNQAQGGNPQDIMKATASDWIAGLLFTAPMGDKSDVRLGMSFSHIFKEDRSISTTFGKDQTPRKLLIHGTMYNTVSKRFMFMPSFMLQRQNATMELQVQGMGSYLFNPEKDIWLNFGLGLRPMNSTDAIVFLGADIKDIRIALSYDINFAGFTAATGTVGAMELGVSYIYKLFKKPNVDPTLICPRM